MKNEMINPVEPMLIDALKATNKPTLIVDVSKFIWNKYYDELKANDELFFKWQYQLRWAKDHLKSCGILATKKQGVYSLWYLTGKGV